MRALQLLVLFLSGLVGAQQQALMDYLERRLLAIEVRTTMLSHPDPGLQTAVGRNLKISERRTKKAIDNRLNFN